MPRQIFESTLETTQKELFSWHTRPGAFERLVPPWQTIELLEPAVVENGSRAQLKLRKGPFRLRWTARHEQVTPHSGFTDVQERGPFARWAHHHEFEAGPEGTTLRDRIDYALPGGFLGRAVAGRQVRRDLETTFAYRHRTTARDLARHRLFAGRPRFSVAVSGSSGVIGRSLVPFLTTGGHQVVRLVRRASTAPGTAHWTPDDGLVDPQSLSGVDAVVHLAGENIAAGRWTPTRKQRIRDSRVEGTRNLVGSLGNLDKPPAVLVCASAIGWYGDRGDDELDESSTPGGGFLAEVCRDWEEAAFEAEALGVRVVVLRFGIVLTPAGGALGKMLPPFRLGVGGRLGDGKQIMSWVSIDDAIGAAYHALCDERLSGPVNVVAPAPVTNREFTLTLGQTLGRPAAFSVPARAVRFLFGEMADALLLGGARVRPEKLEDAGFAFHDPELSTTLPRLLGKAALR